MTDRVSGISGNLFVMVRLHVQWKGKNLGGGDQVEFLTQAPKLVTLFLPPEVKKIETTSNVLSFIDILTDT